jgi:hypothetical protein
MQTETNWASSSRPRETASGRQNFHANLSQVWAKFHDTDRWPVIHSSIDHYALAGAGLVKLSARRMSMSRIPPACTNGSGSNYWQQGPAPSEHSLERGYADHLERCKRGSESNEDFCCRNLRCNDIWRHGSLCQRT